MSPPPSQPVVSRWERGLLILAFAAWTLSPAMAATLGIAGGGESLQNRRLEAFPELDPKGVWKAKWGPRFERWLDDHLPLRDRWLSLDHQFDYYVLGDSPVPEEIALGPSGSMWRIDRLYGRRAGPQPSAEAVIESIEELDAIAREEGLELVVVTSPTKGSLYPELIPAGYRDWFGTYVQREVDALVAYAQTPGTPLVDVWTPMLAERDRLLDPATEVATPRARYLFRLTDRHWSIEAAGIQAAAIVDAIDGVAWDPGRVGAPEEPYEWTESELSDIYVKLGLAEPYSVRPTPDHVHIDKRSKSLSDKRPTARFRVALDPPGRVDPRHVVVVRDSFLNYRKSTPRHAMGGGLDLVAAHFAQTVAVHGLSVIEETPGREEFVQPVDVVVIQVVQDNSKHLVKSKARYAEFLRSLKKRAPKLPPSTPKQDGTARDPGE